MLALALSLLPTVALADDAAEPYAQLEVGRTYYFDLSDVDIPGTVNGALPDTTLHYVPFTYVGKVQTYRLENEDQTGMNVPAKDRWLFIAEYNIKHTVSWHELKEAGLLYGTGYENNNISYMLRAPSIIEDKYSFSSSRSDWKNIQNKLSELNEAEVAAKGLKNSIQNCNNVYSWGQDDRNAGNGYYGGNGRISSGDKTYKGGDCGYRPVLDIQSDPEATDFQVVTLNLNGGSLGDEAQIKLAIKAGEAYDAPSFDGLGKPDYIGEYDACYWQDEDGHLYEPGDVVASDVTELTAVWGYTGITVTAADGKEVEVTAQNSGDVLSDGGSVKYDASRATLELNGAKLARIEAEGPLALQLQGTNTVTAETGDAITAKALGVLGDGSLNVTAKDGRAIHLTEAPTAYFQQGGNVTLQGTLEADTDDWRLLFSGKTLTIHAEIDMNTLAVVLQAAREGKMPEGTKLTIRTDKGQSVSVTTTQDYDEMMRRLDELIDETKTWGDAGDDFTLNYLRLSAPGADSFDPGWAAILPLAGDNNPFRDVRATDWYYQDVMYAYEKGLVNGTAFDRFSPQETFTRGMLLTILARHDGVRTNGTPWYQAGCDWALANGISDGKNPEEAISREEFAQILYRYAAYRGSHTLAGNDISSFTDAGAVSPEALPAVQWAVAQTILRGDNYRLNPQGKTTRAEAAAMLHRFF